MFTPISDTLRATVLGTVAVLSGCAGSPDVAGQSVGMRGRVVAALRVSDREVVIQGPPGYCIDRRTTQDKPSGSFVMLGNCAVLREQGRTPEVPGVLTALVSPRANIPLKPTPSQLLTFFRSARGHAALSFDDTPSSVTILASRIDGDVLYLRVRDESAGRPAGLSDLSWRAIFPLADRIVSLSSTAHLDRPISDEAARDLLHRFVETMKKANPDPETQQKT